MEWCVVLAAALAVAVAAVFRARRAASRVDELVAAGPPPTRAAPAGDVETDAALLGRKVEALQALLDGTGPYSTVTEVLCAACAVAPRLLATPGAAAFLERAGSDAIIRAHAGFGPSGPSRSLLPLASTPAGHALEAADVVAVDDLSERVDIEASESDAARFASVIAAPVEVGADVMGAIEVYAPTPVRWTAEQREAMRWLARLCGRVWADARLREDLMRARNGGRWTEESMVEKPPVRVAEGTDRRPIRVLLADDHAVLRQGLASVLGSEPDIEVVGQVADGVAAVAVAAEARPDVIVMDVSMPRLNGVEATRRIRTLDPGVHVVALSLHERLDMAEAMLAAGADSYVPKGGPVDDLVHAIRRAGGRG